MTNRKFIEYMSGAISLTSRIATASNHRLCTTESGVTYGNSDVIGRRLILQVALFSHGMEVF